MNCSKDFTPRLRLWSTVRWGALNIEPRASRRVGARSCVRVHLAGPRRGQGGVWRRVAAITPARGLLRTYDGLLGSPFSRQRDFDDQLIRLRTSGMARRSWNFCFGSLADIAAVLPNVRFT